MDLEQRCVPVRRGSRRDGGAQRFYAGNFFNPSDNLFVFLYAISA
jgi:hypothetical protein